MMARTLAQVDARLTTEITNRAAADAKLDARLKALEAPVPTPVPAPVPTPAPTPPPTGYTFSDDFTDLSKWNLSTEWGGTGLSSESHNDPSMVTIVNGQMRLRAERGSTPSGRPWRSAVAETKGRFSQLYGNFQARMSYPKGQGLWPAFWLLDATTEGPRPELDVIEAYPHPGNGGGPTQYAMTNHYRKADGTMGQLTNWCKPGFDLTTGFHVFELEWRKDLLIARCDGIEMGRQTANVPAVPMFVIFDHVVGSWAGLSDATTPSPADLLVDWVRVTA